MQAGLAVPDVTFEQQQQQRLLLWCCLQRTPAAPPRQRMRLLHVLNATCPVCTPQELQQ
jgi:hypothetical protein